ncbi:MAG: hypothetical protein GYA17_10925, partial [Chloroflexi bacterium]|nr:hypothetical protein [Chloroflexota bacterium]
MPEGSAAAQMVFHTPGFHSYQTGEHDNRAVQEFVTISVTGTACALHCEHCNTR